MRGSSVQTWPIWKPLEEAEALQPQELLPCFSCSNKTHFSAPSVHLSVCLSVHGFFFFAIWFRRPNRPTWRNVGLRSPNLKGHAGICLNSTLTSPILTASLPLWPQREVVDQAGDPYHSRPRDTELIVSVCVCVCVSVRWQREGEVDIEEPWGHRKSTETVGLREWSLSDWAEDSQGWGKRKWSKPGKREVMEFIFFPPCLCLWTNLWHYYLRAGAKIKCCQWCRPSLEDAEASSSRTFSDHWNQRYSIYCTLCERKTHLAFKQLSSNNLIVIKQSLLLGSDSADRQQSEKDFLTQGLLASLAWLRSSNY